VKIPKLLLFGAGYVLGTRAGRERDEDLRDLARRMAEQLDRRVSADDPAAGGSRTAGSSQTG